MPRVDVEGVGPVDFPDDMTQEDMAHVIETELLPQHDAHAAAAPATPARPVHTDTAPVTPEEPNLLERFGHGMSQVVTGAKQRLLQFQEFLGRAPEYRWNAETKNYDVVQRVPEESSQSYTDKINDQERLYQQGRGPDANDLPE